MGDDRFCNICGSNEIGDDYHYVMSCDALKEERKKLLPHCTYNPNSKYSQTCPCGNLY